MEKIMQFVVNNKVYTVYIVDKIEGKDSYIGETNYETRDILIEKGSIQEMIDTFGHELAHVWLYENGHPYQSGGCFTYEEVCELISYSSESVSRLINDFIYILLNKER